MSSGSIGFYQRIDLLIARNDDKTLLQFLIDRSIGRSFWSRCNGL
jgi:hypothetical protein